jgi:6-pyruvoyltetrahydropterin/6-carboxytetrahydropterin synthase
MFEVEITRNFSAAHRLDNYNGDCSRLHGHNWIVRVTAKAEKLDDIGISVDFRKLKNALDSVLALMDHNNLNEIPTFQGANPTSEIIARYIYAEMSKTINSKHVRIAKVTVSESPDSTASYYE